MPAVSPSSAEPRGIGAVLRRAGAELAGDVRDAAAHGVAVDDVVVRDEGGVQQFVRGRHGVERGRVVGIAAERGERRDDEGRAPSLAAADGAAHRLAEGVESGPAARHPPLDVATAPLELAVELLFCVGGEWCHEARRWASGSASEEVQLLGLQHEPGAECPRRAGERCGEVGGVHPPRLGHLERIEAQLVVGAGGVDGADLVLDDAARIDRAVAEEGEGELDVGEGDPELVLGSAVHRLQHRLGGARVAAEGVAPYTRPGGLAERAAGHEHAALLVHHVAREREVQRRVRAVHAALRGGADLSALVIQKDDVIGVGHESSIC